MSSKRPDLSVCGTLIQHKLDQENIDKCFSSASLARNRVKTYYSLAMALIPIKTASETGYCDCICGCYELASMRDEDTGKGYCPACGKDHLELNTGAGIPQPAPATVSPNTASTRRTAAMPSPADPPGRLR